MKKLYIIALVFILAISLLTACGGNNGSKQEAQGPPQSEGEPASTTNDGDATDPLIKWMQDGKFSFDYTCTLEFEGTKTETAGSMAVDGEKAAYTTEMTVEGEQIKSRMIMKDDKVYIINDESKTIMVMATSDEDTDESVMTDYTGIVKVGSGRGEINGRNLPYDEYSDAEMEASVKYYYDGDKIYGYVTESERNKSTMIITNQKNSVPAGAFDLPDGYVQISF